MGADTSNPLPLQVALVVIADEDLRALVAEALYSFEPGFTVASAPDAAPACEWLQRISPSLVVLGPEAVVSSDSHKVLAASGRDCRFLIYGTSPLFSDPGQRRVARLPPKLDLPALLAAIRGLFAAAEGDAGITTARTQVPTRSLVRLASGTKEG